MVHPPEKFDPEVGQTELPLYRWQVRYDGCVVRVIELRRRETSNSTTGQVLIDNGRTWELVDPENLYATPHEAYTSLGAKLNKQAADIMARTVNLPKELKAELDRK